MEKNLQKPYEIYVIEDMICEKVGPVFQVENEIVARRWFKTFLDKQEFPNDFTLIRVGYLQGKELTPELQIIQTENFTERFKDELPDNFNEMEYQRELKKIK